MQSLVTGPQANINVGSLQNMTYQYDNAGNITNITNNVASETSTFGYDQLHRLTSWNLNGTIENYSYDATTGNLSSKAGTTLHTMMQVINMRLRVQEVILILMMPTEIKSPEL